MKLGAAPGCGIAGEWIDPLRRAEWVVYAKPPFGGPKKVLDYLGRYTHRVAIANHRILEVGDGKVTFQWRDYRHGNQQKTMTLAAEEFIRRFLLHVLPSGFVRIRYFGFLANRYRAERIEQARTLLGPGADDICLDRDDAGGDGHFPWRLDKDIDLCPKCRRGRLVRIEVLAPDRDHPVGIEGIDSS